MAHEIIEEGANKPFEPCNLYSNKTNWDDCELCKQRSTCGPWLIVSRLNRLEQRIRQLERGGPRP
jgi:hypothetical protein